MSQPDPYLCVNCFDAFNIRNPNSHPRILRCQHNMCTRCLRQFISDLTKLTSSNSHFSTTGSKLTCTLCRMFSPIDNEGIDRFPVNNQILNNLEIQILNELEQEAISKAKTLEKWDNRLNRDSLGLDSLISNGLTEMKQHYEYLSKRLTEEYNYSVHTFTQKHARIRRKFFTDINLIQKQKDDITYLLRNRDISNTNTNQFQKSIFDTDSLINKLIQHSNLSELDNINSIVNNFTSKSISTQHTAPTPTHILPAIQTAQGTYTPRQHSVPNELSRSVDRSCSQTRLPVDIHSVYDSRPLTPINRISTVPDNSYRQSVSPVPWSQPLTPPKQPILHPTRSCLSPTRSPHPSNNPTIQQLSPSHNPSFLSPTYSPAHSFLRPAISSYRQPQLSPSHKPTLRTPTHHPMH